MRNAAHSTLGHQEKSPVAELKTQSFPLSVITPLFRIHFHLFFACVTWAKTRQRAPRSAYTRRGVPTFSNCDSTRFFVSGSLSSSATRRTSEPRDFEQSHIRIAPESLRSSAPSSGEPAASGAVRPRVSSGMAHTKTAQPYPAMPLLAHWAQALAAAEMAPARAASVSRGLQQRHRPPSRAPCACVHRPHAPASARQLRAAAQAEGAPARPSP